MSSMPSESPIRKTGLSVFELFQRCQDIARDETLTANETHLLIQMILHANFSDHDRNGNGHLIWPTQKRLARLTKLSLRTVKYTLRALRKKRLIKVTKHRKNKKRNRYELVFLRPLIGARAAPNRGKSCTQIGARAAPKLVLSTTCDSELSAGARARARAGHSDSSFSSSGTRKERKTNEQRRKLEIERLITAVEEGNLYIEHSTPREVLGEWLGSKPVSVLIAEIKRCDYPPFIRKRQRKPSKPERYTEEEQRRLDLSINLGRPPEYSKIRKGGRNGVGSKP